MSPLKGRLVNYFRKLASLSAEEADAVEQSMRVRGFQKGAVLLEAGQVCTACYFVLEGCVRQYSLVDGEERTVAFFTEDQWVVSLASFMTRSPADHFLVCEEDTSLVVGDEACEQVLYRRFPRFETISRLVVEKMLIEEQARVAAYVTDTPEQRYLKLRQARPGLLDRVPQYQVASYVGVRPESLSRIRRRLVTGQKKG